MARDFDILASVKAALEAAETDGVGKAFEAVCLHEPLEAPPGGDVAAVVFVSPATGTAETEGSPGAGGADADLGEQHEFALTIAVADDDPERRTERLSLMVAAAKAALNGNGFNGACIPTYSLITRWRYLVSRHAWKACQATFRCRQLITGSAGADTTDAVDMLA